MILNSEETKSLGDLLADKGIINAVKYEVKNGKGIEIKEKSGKGCEKVRGD